MEKIDSFRINHLTLKRGVYVSRRDEFPSGEAVTTFDVRMTEPNRQEALTPKSLHAIEHLAATYLRNHAKWGSKVIYWGPMGCCTGNYLLMRGRLESKDMVSLLQETFRFISEFEGEVPGATAKDCGNYTFMDLGQAKKDAKEYLQVLEHLQADQLIYPD